VRKRIVHDALLVGVHVSLAYRAHAERSGAIRGSNPGRLRPWESAVMW